MEYITCTAGREEEVLALWRECFPEDSEEYLGWLMANKYSAERCKALLIGGRIAALTHLLPLSLRLHGIKTPLPFLYGVGTLKEFRHRGLATKLMEQLMAEERAKGTRFLGLYPFNHGFYKKLGYGVLDRSALCSVPACEGEIQTVPLGPDVMLNVFSAMAAGYDPAPERDETRCAQRISEWQSDGGLALDFGGAYALCAKLGNKLFAEELAYADLESGRKAIKTLAALACDLGCETVQFRLSQREKDCFGVAYEPEPHAMIRIVDVMTAFVGVRAKDGARLCIELSDPIAPWNNGVFTFAEKNGSLAVLRGGTDPVPMTVDELTDRLFANDGGGLLPENDALFFEHY